MIRNTVIGLLLMVLFLSGCNSYQNATNTNDTTVVEPTTEKIEAEEHITQQAEISFTDDLGREVIVSKNNRVAALMGSLADVWILSGGEVVAASKDTWSNFDLNLPDTVINTGSLLKPDLELLISSKPEFILASSNLEAHVELEDVFTQAGIQVAYLDINHFNDYLRVLKLFTLITGEEQNYEIYGTKVKEQVDEALSLADESHPKILYLRASGDNVKAKGSEGNVGSEILKELGCVNIADSDERLLDDLSMEAIIEENPDYIFVTTQGEDTEQALSVVESSLQSNPAWHSLTAVKEGRYYVLDKNLYNTKPNAKWGEAYRQLANILYGDK